MLTIQRPSIPGATGAMGPQGPPGAANSMYSATWVWTTKTTDAGTSGQVGINATTWATATTVHLNQQTDTNQDTSAVLAKVKVGDSFYLQQKTDATRWGRYLVTEAGVDQGTWWSWVVVHEESGGNPPNGNAQTSVSVLAEGAQVEEWLGASGVPAVDLGKVGDWYLQYDTGDVYEKTAGETWTLRTNIRGPQGPGLGAGLANKVGIWESATTLNYDTSLHFDTVNGRLGIGTSTPTAPLHVTRTLDIATNAAHLGTDVTYAARFTAATMAIPYASRITATINQNGFNLAATGNPFSAALGIDLRATGASGNAFVLNGVYVQGGNTGAGTVQDYSAFRVDAFVNSGGGTITALRGFVFVDPVGTNYGEVTAYYGGLSAGTGRWNLFMPGGASNLLQGDTGIGGNPYPGVKLNVEGSLRTSNRLDVGGISQLNGNVAIGTSSTTAPLTFPSTLGHKIHFYHGGGNDIYGMSMSSGALDIFAGSGNYVQIGAIETSGAYTVRFRTGPSGNQLYMATGIGYAPVAGLWIRAGASAIDSLRLGDGVAPGRTLDVNGYSIFRNLVGISYDINTSYWLRCPNGYFDSLYVGWTGGGYELMTNRFYAAGASNFNSTLYVMGAGTYNSTLTINGPLYPSGINGIVMQSSSNFGTYTLARGLAGSPAWNICRMQFAHVHGNWAGVQFDTDGSGYQFNFHLSSGYAYATNGPWVDGPSDRTLKRHIVVIDAPLARLAKLNGCHYERTDVVQREEFAPLNPYEYGLIAQDVADALPDAAFQHDYGAKGVLWNYYDRPILALLVESVKALHARLEALEAKDAA